MSNRLFDLMVRILSVAVATMVVGATTVALVLAAAEKTAPTAAGTGIHYNNLLLDAVAAPNYAAVILFGTVFFIIGSMRKRRAKARFGTKR